ncbi:metallophosphoesterase [uncultured Alistipes sp.]|uniref:metallophosphoesterase family protein n=1 Tax=uncultured Alistipes sp. TaxID=538949 RepID=UPI00262AABA5|nr:metallophosphoesterase [uncultured Alistipes sp.]
MKRIAALCAALLSTACRVEYHPYDTRIEGRREINSANIARIEAACAERTTIRLALISDTQRHYDETAAAVRALNARDDVDFVIHAGDMTDFGMRAEFERQRDLLERLRVPYVVLPGNHDCLATGERIFTELFGPVDFAFTAGSVRFVCLNTNALEFGHDTPVPNFDFLERQIADPPARVRTSVAVMHARPGTEQFDNNVARLFHRTLRQLPGLQCCLNGHGHRFAAEELFDDGIVYYQCDDIGRKAYLLFTLTEEGYDYERVEF